MAKSATVIEGDFQPTKPIRRKLNLRTPVGKVNNHSIEVQHDKDPKKTLLENLGPLPSEIVQGSRILVAVYVPPMVAKTSGGIMLPDALKEEDINEYCWQGKVGLIVAMGNKAYVDSDDVKFDGATNNIGDWVWFMPSNGQGCYVNQVFCRMFQSELYINGKVAHPDFVW